MKKFGLIRKVLYLLTPKEKRRGAVVFALMVIMAVLEMAGIASVMPFLSVLGNPGMVQTNPMLADLYAALNFQSIDAFLFALGAAAFVMILASAIFRTITYYAMNRYVEMRRHSIGERLLETYLQQPYAFFLDRHSGDMAKSILSEVDQVVNNIFRPGMRMIAYGVVVIVLIIFLVAVNPKLAVSVAIVIGGLYVLIFYGVRGVLSRVGRDRADANRERFTAAAEALGGIKDIKLLGRERAYLSRFRGPSIRQARHQATSHTLAEVPKYLIEAVGFGGVIVLILVLLATQGGITGGTLGDILPVLGLYVFAGYRLLPAAQNIYLGAAKLRFGAAAVDGIYEDLYSLRSLAEISNHLPQSLVPRQAVALRNITFTYPHAGAPALEDIDLTIPVGTSVGLVGSTGAGKTTLVDVILGLLRPSEGAIVVDNEPVTEDKLREWQRTLGYVPQDIFLSDSSVAENIALGVPKEELDHKKITRCAEMAQLHDFIMQDLPHKYDTVVGERGVRLSGGQRQRIGIARALYHDPSVLVFDEATSALDTVTEQALMEAIEALAHQKTIILIAHRLSTVRSCDNVVLLEKGHVIAAGKFEELKNSSQQFRAMAGTAGT